MISYFWVFQLKFAKEHANKPPPVDPNYGIDYKKVLTNLKKYKVR
jgi:hypothetical protein